MFDNLLDIGLWFNNGICTGFILLSRTYFNNIHAPIEPVTVSFQARYYCKLEFMAGYRE